MQHLHSDIELELLACLAIHSFPVCLTQLFRINEANQLMQYDQCLTKGPDGSAVYITHCNMNEHTEWRYFKVGDNQNLFTPSVRDIY